MSQLKKYKDCMEEVREWKIESAKLAMLMLIAENTAIIADSMSREDGDQIEAPKQIKNTEPTVTYKGQPLQYAEDGFVKSYCVREDGEQNDN